MKREDLKTLGLTEEQIDKVMTLHGSNVEDLKTANAKVDTLTTQLKEANSQIDTLNKKVSESGNIDDLKKEMADLKTDYESQIESMKYDHEVNTFLAGVNFSSELVKKAVTAEFKEKGFKLSDGKLLGAEDYISELKKSQPNAFAEEKKTDPEVKTGIKTDGIDDNNNSGGGNSPEFKPFF